MASERPAFDTGEERIVPMRLQRFLARAGVASRRGSERLMSAGRVRVNGVVTTEMGSKVDPRVDVVTVDGRVVSLANEHAYLMLNKPAGYLTTMSDPYGRPCVSELVPTADFPGLFPVGRLDADTTGLLLFTTDGDLAQRLLHPSSHVWKHYLALVEGVPDEEALARLRAGVDMEGGRAQPAREVELYEPDDPRCRPVAPRGVAKGRSVAGLSIHEGKKHQVKLMLSAIGCEVVRLHRDRFGALDLGRLRPGDFRMLADDETNALRS